MKNFVKITLVLFLAAIFACSIIITGCKKKEKEVPPPIPPKSTMAIDVSNFGGTSQKNVLDTNQNWNRAAFTVGVWNAILFVNLAVPVTAFIESFKHTPVQLSDGTWEWTYSGWAFLQNYSAKLQGKTDGSQISWKMYLSVTGKFSNFLWFTGTSNTEGTLGTWDLNKDPDMPQPYIHIDWSRDNSLGTASVKYTDVLATDTVWYNGYVQYGLTTNSPNNAYYTIYKASTGSTTNIEWNTTAKDGRIKSHEWYSDDQWHCWNSSHMNIVCP